MTSLVCSCAEYYSSDWMFYTILYCGSTCSLISAAFNVLIFVALLRDGRRRSTYFLYLIVLAACDVVLCALYVPLIVIDQVLYATFA